MPEIKLEIGNRQFAVVCEEGEEPALQKAAALMDIEAQNLQSAIGRVPEARMLLMAGLMLADRMSVLEDSTAKSERRIRILEEQIKSVEAKAAQLATSALKMTDDNSEAGQARAEADAALQALERATRTVEAIAAQLR